MTILLKDFPILSELENLEELSMDNIEGIADDVMNFPFDKLTNLKTVSLKNLGLPAIPEALFKCRNLEYLFVDNNNISEIPDSVGDFKNLERIRFEGNNVKVVPDSLGECINLLEVDMVSNPLENVTERLLELDKLDYIRISRPSVHCLDNFFDELNERISIYIR